MLIPTGFEAAVIGVVRRFNDTFILLNEEMCIEILVNDGMVHEEAVEYFEYNVIGAWMGSDTPAYLSSGLSVEELSEQYD